MKIKDFDFTKPRVRYHGKVLDKFHLGLILNEIKPSLKWDIIYDAFSYSELRRQLITYLS